MFSIFNKRKKPNPKVLDEPVQLGINCTVNEDDPCKIDENENTNSNSNKDTFVPQLSTNITVSKIIYIFLY